MTSYDNCYVSMAVANMNNNNLQTGGEYPYQFFDAKTGLVFNRIVQVPKGIPMCSLCFREFKSFTEQEIHKARPCFMDTKSSSNDKPVRVSFAPGHLVFIADILRSLSLEITIAEDGMHSFVVDQTNLEITLRRLYTGETTKFNIEEWYPSLEDLGDRLGCQLTSKTFFRTLTDAELKLISSLASINLAQNLGLSSHETNAELAAKEILEDDISDFLKAASGLQHSNGTDLRPFFIRLSTRSPKDGVATSIDEKQGDLLTRMQTKLDKLKCYTGQDVIELLKKSQRIFSDISFYFQYRCSNSSSGKIRYVCIDICMYYVVHVTVSASFAGTSFPCLR
jgi:hypothetical protein